jgi:hypothetical protein
LVSTFCAKAADVDLQRGTGIEGQTDVATKTAACRLTST